MTNPDLNALTVRMAESLEVDPAALATVLRQQVLANAKVPEVAAFLLVATQYRLNPITKEIYAFPAKGGGIVPIVGVDGWIRLANSHPALDGMSFTEHRGEGGAVEAVTCHIHRKDRAHPTEVTEYLAECRGTTEPWKRWPIRMLRHKAMIQAIRIAFGFAGIYDPDEGERIAAAREAEARSATARPRLADVVEQSTAPARAEVLPPEPGAFDGPEPGAYDQDAALDEALR
jgi:phage recombination protein Bet